jgi:hypothetical protein
LILAQDKRSAVLGQRQNTNHSPVGAVRNRYQEHVSTQSKTGNPHGMLFLFWGTTSEAAEKLGTEGGGGFQPPHKASIINTGFRRG